MNRYFVCSLRLFMIVAATVVISSCFGNWNRWDNLAPNYVHGNGIVRTETRSLESFTRIENTVPVDIEITTRQSAHLEITGDENLLQYVKTEVKNGTLYVSCTAGCAGWSAVLPLKMTISMEMLEAITNGGVGNISVSPLVADQLEIALRGAGNISVEQTNVRQLSARVSGVGRLHIQGTAEQTTLNLSGAGNIQARQLNVQRATVVVSGIGSAYVSVKETLEATVSGAGNIIYYGNPSNIRRTITGVGSIRQGN